VGLLGAMIVGGAVGHYAARRQFESMSAAQAQQQAIQQAQAQSAQALQAAQAAQAQAPSPAKKDPYQELEKLGNLKKQGLITEDEFQKLKMRLLSGI
jgi:type II secretory pathway pseudopilin PulG